MSVAKSYQKYPLIDEPYEHDKRQYILIKIPCCTRKNCSRCHGEGSYAKEVRWYQDPIEFDPRKGFGFCEAGYITLIAGPDDILENHFRNIAPRQARYNLLFQWYIPSWLEKPQLPSDCRYVKLTWEQISRDNKLFDDSIIREIVRSVKEDRLWN